MVANPHQVCENLLLQVKNSKLNFHLSETPFSVTLSSRKRFLKDLSSTSTQEISLSASDRSDNDATISEENKTLRELIETKESEIKALRDTVDILENKVSNAETNLLKHFKETKNIEISYKKEKEESTLLKDVVKNHHGEISKICVENKGLKAQKSKEKEIYNLVNKIDNQQEVIKR